MHNHQVLGTLWRRSVILEVHEVPTLMFCQVSGQQLELYRQSLSESNLPFSALE